MKQVCNGGWDWLVGKQFSLGEVVSVIGNTATVEHGDNCCRVLVCELLEEHDKNNMPIEGFLGERFLIDAGEEIRRLRQAARNVYEVWAGSEGIPMPETVAEAYLLQLVEQMRDEAKNGLHNYAEKSDTATDKNEP